MKKLTSTLVLTFLFSLCLLSNKALANPGDSCSNPYSLVLTNPSDSAFLLRDSITWISFVPDSANPGFQIINPYDTAIGTINVTLYTGSCSSLDSINGRIATPYHKLTPQFMQWSGLVFGETYYIKIRASGINARKANMYYVHIKQVEQYPYAVAPNCTGTAPCSGELITNGDFSQYNTSYCPQYLDAPWTVCSWWNPNDFGTPDYYNNCDNTISSSSCYSPSTTGIPNSETAQSSAVNDHLGVYPPQTSKGYMGLDLYQSFVPSPGCGAVVNEEYIQQKLSAPMVLGEVYNVSFWACLAPNSLYGVDNTSLGMFFSNQQVTKYINSESCGTGPPFYSGPLSDYGGNYIPTTDPSYLVTAANCGCSCDLNYDPGVWVHIYAPYTAKGGENWITIGNFNQPSSTTLYNWGDYDCARDQDAYYFIDDVSVESTPSATITASSNSPICSGSTLNLTASSLSGANYNWTGPNGFSSTSQNPSIINATAAASGVYTVTAGDVSCPIITATVTVTVSDPIVTVTPNPATICTNTGVGSTTLSASTVGGSGMYSYIWQPGSLRGSSVTVSPATTTIYTVTTTDAIGCTGTTTVTVNVDNFRVYSPLGTYTVCPGSCTTLSVFTSGGSAPYTYYWSPPTWLTSTSIANPQVCPPLDATPGTYVYTVGVSDAYYCNGFATFTVVVEPPPTTPTINGPLFGCSIATYSVTNVVAGASYSWTTFGAISLPTSGSGSTASVAFGTYGGYIEFTATGTDGCTSSDYFSVQPCCATGIFTVIPTEKSSQIIGGSNFTNATILINGTLTVDQATKFIGCDVQFTPGSSIIINSGNTLTITPSSTACTHLHAGCDAMWSGIFLNSGAALSVNGASGEGGGVLIEDAESAVVVNPSSTNPGVYNLNEVIFNKDYQDIVINATSANYSGSATNCIFTCRNFSTISCPNWYADWQTGATITTISLTPYSGDITYAGITMSNVYAYANFTGCYFDNMEYGVHSMQSSLGVYGNFFQNIATSNGSYTGVWAESCYDCSPCTSCTYSLVVGGAATTQQNTFTNCNVGVQAGYLDYVTIDYNTFNNNGHAPFAYAIDQGERHTFYPAGNVSIAHNSITNAQNGIRSFNNYNGSIAITCNSIYDPCSGYNYNGIVASEVAQPHLATYGIKSNIIYSPNNGIIESNTYGSWIENNNIYLSPVFGSCPDYSGVGIQSNGCIDGSGCSNGVVAPTMSGSNYYTGIEESQSTSTVINGSYIYNANNDIVFDGTASTGDNALLNTLTTGSQGIVAEAGALFHANIGESGMEAFNIFSGFSSCEINLPYYTSYYCLSNCPTNCLYLPNQTGRYWYPLDCTDDVGCIVWPPMSIKHSIIVPTDSLMSLFMDSVTVTQNRLAADSTTTAYMEKIALSHDTFPEPQDTDKALAKEGVLRVLWDNQSLLSNSILHNFNDSMSSAPMGKILAIDTTIESTFTSSGYSTLLASLNAIVPVNNVEANLQTAAQGFLTYLITDTLTPTQVATVRVLANKCPDWDGDAVYEARALLSMYDTAGTVYSDSCHSGGGHRPIKNNSTETSLSTATFNLYPNPNNGNFTLQYDLGTNSSGNVKIYNTLGEMVGEYTLDNSEGKMNISNSGLSNGVYLWKLYTNNQVIKFGKVIIIK